MGKPDSTRYVTGDTIANEIRQSKSKFAIIVEGQTDIRFYGHLTISGTCEFFDARGKENVLNAIRICNADTQNQTLYIGIVDADFDVIENGYNPPAYPNHVYYTDCHDAEIMGLLPDVWDKIYNEYFASEDKISLEELKRRVKDDAAVLAYLHLASKREKWGASIKSSKKEGEYMSISKLYDSKEFKLLSFDKIAVKVHSNHKMENFSEANVTQKMTEIKNQNHDENQLLNGHHVALILVEYMDKFGKHVNTYNHESVGKDIRMAYRVGDFHKTDLYANLKIYETSNGLKFLK